jgi:quercetin dioxygenase-like cupin family protein
MLGKIGKMRLTNSLHVAMIFSAISWPVWTCAQPAPDVVAKTIEPEEMQWEPLGGGFEISILYTNPTTQATYLVIRGWGRVPRHWHSSNESITVLQGTFTLARDGSPDRTMVDTGGFIYMPAKMIHEAWTGMEGATYFITVDGKWDVNFVE